MFGWFRRGTARATEATGRGLGFTWHLVVLLVSLAGIVMTGRFGMHAVQIARDDQAADRFLWLGVAVLMGLMLIVFVREVIWRALVLRQRRRMHQQDQR